MSKFQAIRGMNDILPQEIIYWHFLENHLKKLAQQYAYQEIRLPLVETTDLFKRGIGEVTDIVEKEMYSFQDRHEDRSLSLRPEGTAGCVRAVIEHGLAYHKTQKLWYLGPLFRHERPQRGRYRQFHQFGVEAFGFKTPDIEAEMLAMMARLWRELKIDAYLTLELNSLGKLSSRERYRQALINYFEQYLTELDEDSQRRLRTNPLRILDSKNPAMAHIIAQAPKLADYLDDESKTHFETLQMYLQQLNIPYILNPRLVRGLDYYSDTVFEWTTTELGAQSAVCAGGRYDILVELLGGQPTSAVGFAMGCERVIELIKLKHTSDELTKSSDIYLVLVGADTEKYGLMLAEKLRNDLPNLTISTHFGGGQFKNQLKRADQSGAKVALILGENELAEHKITVKFLRKERTQETLYQTDLVPFLQAIFN